MDNMTSEHETWLEHLSEEKLRGLIGGMSVNPTEAQQAYVEYLRMLLADRMGRRSFWTGRGNTRPVPLA